MTEEKHGQRIVESDSNTGDEQYELDLDKHSTSSLDEAIQDAVEAVERAETEHSNEMAEPIVVKAAEDETSGVAEAPEDAQQEETPPADAAKLQAEVESLRERLVRTLADFDNFRKRTDRQKESLRRMGTFEVVRDFLAVIDNLERALESSGSVEDLKQGLKMILRQQEEVLRRHGVERLEVVGQPFDPTIHEAVASQEQAEVDEPTVTAELQKGYMLHDRLLRPSMVHVATPPAGAERASAGKATEEARDGAEQEVARSEV